MRRRTFLTAAAAMSLARPAIAASARAGTLRFVPQADLTVLDPVWTTTYPTRDHGFLVFDTLYGQQGPAQGYAPAPQMVAGHTVSSDGLTWRLTLRQGLRFHDGTPVLARDCAASVRRWGARDSFGQALMAATDALSALDDSTLQFRLKRPFPLLPAALAKISPSMCPMMPERLARTDPNTAITEMVGSGPYRYIAAERVPGSRVVYERFAGYVPRDGGVPDWTAGPKVARFDRVEWHILPDPATALAALATGEVDWWWQPDLDLMPVLRTTPNVRTRVNDPNGYIGTMRMDWTQKPFHDAAVRRAVLAAVNQAEFMSAVAGTDRSMWHDGIGYFCPGTPMASQAGLAAFQGSVEAGRRLLGASGYDGTPVALLAPTDIATVKACADISADMLHKLGMKVDYQAMDWGTLVQRRTLDKPSDAGGWSMFSTFWSGLDQYNPAVNAFLRANGAEAPPGWPDDPRLEALREQWFLASGLAQQQSICADMQREAVDAVPYIPLGQYVTPTAFRHDIQGIVPGEPVFWNVHRA